MTRIIISKDVQIQSEMLLEKGAPDQSECVNERNLWDPPPS
jgi:hypothetical protein